MEVGDTPTPADLSIRQKRVFELMAVGLTNAEIARILDIGVRLWQPTGARAVCAEKGHRSRDRA